MCGGKEFTGRRERAGEDESLSLRSSRPFPDREPMHAVSAADGSRDTRSQFPERTSGKGVMLIRFQGCDGRSYRVISGQPRAGHP